MTLLGEDIGFKEQFCGNANDAVIKYGPKERDSTIDLEFLCDFSGLSKKDQQRAAIPVQKGLYAQPLRYMGMSFHNTWHVQLQRVPGFEQMKDVIVRLPNPAAYVVSKVLIRGERRLPPSMDKDCFYIYEVSVVFRDALDLIRKEYDRLEACVPKWKKRFSRNARKLFASETAEGPISAVQVYRDLGELRGQDFDVTEEMVYRSVGRLLKAIIG